MSFKKIIIITCEWTKLAERESNKSVMESLVIVEEEQTARVPPQTLVDNT
jgi:hypothetical protein